MDIRSKALSAARTLGLLACGITVATALHAATIPGTAALPEDRALIGRLSSNENISHPYPWLWTGGQPDSVTLVALAEAGVRDVFDLRAAGESRGYEECTVTRELGLRYLPVPSTAADFDDEKFTAFRHHLIAHGPGNAMFIHCASGNRVGAVLLPWLVLDEGLSEDLALAMARGIGLRDAALTQRALEYIRARVSQTPLR